MRGTLDFDPETRDYGPASREIRAVIREYADVDWFEPGGDLEGAARAFREHETLAGVPHAALDLVFGTRDDFSDLCATVRGNPTWQWRFQLKALLQRHSKAHGWRIDDQPTGHLFARIGAGVVWRLPTPTLQLDYDGNWYRGYANGDPLDAIQWWLAEPTATGNPYVPLIRCYRLGVYPFSLSRTKAVLFAFKFTGKQLPVARLLR